MQDPVLLNGKLRCTLIQRFDRSFAVIAPGGTEKLDSFRSVSDVEAEVERRGWVIGIVHPTLVNKEEV